LQAYTNGMSTRMPPATAVRAGRILVVDDERNIVRLLEAYLSRHGHSVAKAYDGLEALLLVKQEKFDLLILDVMMPFMDGYEVLKNLRKDPATAETPVIILTAKSADEDVFEAYHLGAHMFLSKPVDLDMLALFVRQLLG
jgi:two-component system alkaline phosphatase synthesis response regulator PhoP